MHPFFVQIKEEITVNVDFRVILKPRQKTDAVFNAGGKWGVLSRE